MPLEITLTEILEKRNMSASELARRIGITYANLSKIKNGRIKAIRLDTLEKICRQLKCRPADILDYYPDPPNNS